MSQKPSYVGVDDGHYAIKVVTESGKTFSVPSRARSGKHLLSWQENDGDGGFYTTQEGRTYTVNKHLTNYEDTRFKEYPKSPLNRVLVHHALREAGFGGKEVIIATGLPVSYYYLANGSRDDALINAKVDNLKRGVTCGLHPMAKIKKNVVATEAIAAYFDQLMDLDGNTTPEYDQLAEATVGVIDIGGKTTDCAVIFPGGEQVDADRSGSGDYGVLLLNDTVESRLRVLFDLDLVPPRLIEQAITHGIVKIAGEEHDVRDMIKAEKESLAERIMSTVRTKIGGGKDLDFVLFVGGGALVMREQLAKHYPHSRFPDSPVYANARGMLKIAKYVFGGEE
ncbi:MULTISPECIES: ParM/StbA family protein [Xanthomonas]|uniref:StbA family protein n=5 Tax=Xanthomonas TaxID=338 RepID=A0A7Z7IZY9_XANCH|nr:MULTISPECIES: ParM/StbA family protein [Xanthomonas]ATS86813.1 ParM/StbA family protein [Xanthomonas citri pv. phaseoli var. fuscans]KGT54031.1 hypothetical protein NY96_19820 [Xanthomonas citri pv. fuscans]MBV6747196.1 ParM/StbA family protein [Xanthomonas vasicola pv. vasculorum NCPPB 890]MBV6892733.1 ParM/StbA family protein [Xanthomonas vasicola pv. vasculorum]MDO6948479.1 ParM/StbA family protein [Xanthomonas vasicola]